ncbi:putative secreted RxLR effector protein [Phytophthora cinnamomi]|uniref:putative secreted RxLR effector protein n=1 Tax=Phytophthora cinnamomi TaxID=4785 RepID=UPI00355947C0|nr:putative secreted RxLR effector protein [Phytophthora cinnamomi]
MRFSLTLLLTMIALIASFATVFANAEATNEETPDTSRNLRVGIIDLKAGSRSAQMIVMLNDDPAASEGSPAVLEITQPDAGDSEERSVATASWAQALKNFIKDPVLFTKMFVYIRKYFAHIH